MRMTSGLTPCASHGHGDRPAEGWGQGRAPGRGENWGPCLDALSALEGFMVVFSSLHRTQATQPGAESSLESLAFLASPLSSWPPPQPLRCRFTLSSVQHPHCAGQ